MSSPIPILTFFLPSNRSLSFPSLVFVNRVRISKFRRFGTSASAADVDVKYGGDSFFAKESISWESLGVSDTLNQALSRVGLSRPSSVQASCIPSILSGADTVIAAETGSGKTHGYLVPLMDRLFRTTIGSEEALAGQALNKKREISLVLCPNVMLCEQVVRMANCLCHEDGQAILSAVAICGRQGWSTLEPNLIVSTPVALLNHLYAIDVEAHRRSDFIRSVKYVVIDEADMLLSGGFQNQVIRLLNMLRFDEKKISGLSGSNSLDKMVSELVSEMDSGDEKDKDLQEVSDARYVENLQTCITENLETKSDIKSLGNKPHIDQRKDWRRVRKSYERSKQYIFVAATLPVNGKQTAGGVLKRLFPDASWVSGNYVHCHSPRLDQKWIEVTVDTQVDALISALSIGFNKVLSSSSDISRIMVFANTVESVEAISKVLAGAGIDCFSYHSDRPLEERTKSLSVFRLKGGVLVCTDSASRGLDVPNVSHVIQAEFATSAVDFLHRVGRTARAGQAGLVTSLYTQSDRDLVAAIREAEKQGVPVEKVFSRKRSFRNKMKKKRSLREL